MPSVPADETLRADAVVVGSGAGGGPVAAVLAEAGLEVVVLDAGPRFATSELTGDEGEMTARLYAMSQTLGSGLALYSGVCVGGSTVINDALCWRTPPEILDAWRREHGLTALTDAAFAPFVERAWRDVSATPTDRAHTSRNAHALERGARALGWAAQPMDRAVRGCVNLGLCNFGCPSGAKQSTLLTYVPRAEHAGARVVPNARAERIELEAGAARGVQAIRLDPVSRAPGGRLRVEAPLVVVAAGVLGTAALLLRSGISGDAIGRHLQLHTSLHVTARFDEPVHGYYGPTMAYAVTEFSDVNGRSGPGFMIENTAVHPIATASALPGFGAEHAERMAQLPYLARALVVLRDRTRGRIRLAAEGRPALDYDLVPADRQRLHDGMLAIARAYLAAGAREVWLPLNGAPPVQSEADLAAVGAGPLEPGRTSLLYAVHLFGGATLGGDAASACDEDGRVRDVRGVAVADAASLPSNTGVNPQITVIANALRIGETLASERHG